MINQEDPDDDEPADWTVMDQLAKSNEICPIKRTGEQI